jgi:putative nucleotidyltransferase with HDIG domain
VRGTLAVPSASVDHQLTDLSTKIEGRAEGLYRRYRYPDWLRTHSLLVGRIALLLASARADEGGDVEAVALAGYLHDIGRSPLLEGDRREHNELSVLILAAEGLAPLAEMARRHPVYAVLDPATAPRTLAEKIVHVADRRGGMRVMPLEERSAETAVRHPRYAAQIERATPIARDLEREVFAGLPFPPAELAERVAALWP